MGERDPEAEDREFLRSVVTRKRADGLPRWTQSEDLQTAPMNRPLEEMSAGRSVFEMHEIIQLGDRPTPR